jgi:hypothetical protein
MYVEEDAYLNATHDGTVVRYSLGLLFEEDEVFTIGEGALATNIIIPKGAATPAITLAAVPFFGGIGGYGPSQFFLNDDWTEHAELLTLLGFTIVTNDATEFSVINIDPYGGILEGTWRKSDGVNTYYHIDGFNQTSMFDMTGVEIELSLNRKESNPLTATVGTSVSFTAEMLDIDVTGTGDLWTDVNQTELNSILDIYRGIEGNIFMTIVVTDVLGCYYVADTYMYNPMTEMLEKSSDPTLFNGFVGSIDVSMPPEPSIELAKGISLNYFAGPGPIVTPDWDIYEGQMKLYDTLLSVYANDLLDLAEIPSEYLTYNTLGGNLELEKDGDYYYFRELFGLNMDQNYESMSSVIIPNEVYSMGTNTLVEEEGYLCYHKTGIGAAIRFKADLTINYYAPTTYTGGDTGSMTYSINIYLKNPLYNPKDLLGNKFIPGFTWLIAFPALFSIAIITIIRKRRN